MPQIEEALYQAMVELPSWLLQAIIEDPNRASYIAAQIEDERANAIGGS